MSDISSPSISSDETSSSSSKASVRPKFPKNKGSHDAKEQSSPSIKSVSVSREDDSNDTSENLKSSLDINSISLTDEQKQPNRPPSSVVHNHILPSGWTCNYDETNDEYKFQFIGHSEDQQQQQQHDDKHKYCTKSTNKRSNLIDKESMTTEKYFDDKDIKDYTKAHRPTLDFTKECKYGYHFPSSPTPSMLSELAKQVQKAPATAPQAKVKQFGYGKTKLTMLSDEEEQVKRLKEMFPTATGPVVDQMIKIYQGREGCIKAALISLGYKRATDYGGQQGTAQTPIMLMMSKPASKKLFDKLVSYFPDKDETLIKNLMYQHKEVEHEIISILVESGGQLEIGSRQSKSSSSKHDKNGAIMKLRYLKFLFPTCEEIELYHLLHCNDLDAQKVIEQVEKRGHKRANIDQVMQNRKTQTQQMKAQQAALAIKEKAPLTNPLELHRKRTKPTVSEARINNQKENLKKSLGSDLALITDGLLSAALEASDYNEGLARKFLQEMAPIDESKYKQRFVIEREQQPLVVLYPCKGIQKSTEDTSFMSVTANDYVSIPREVVECTTALALLKVDACTFTQDDMTPTKFSHKIGRKENLASGSIFKTLEIKDSLRRGAKNKEISIGSKYRQVCEIENRPKANEKAKRRNKLLTIGRNSKLNHGHNAELIQRIHPFFLEPNKFFV